MISRLSKRLPSTSRLALPAARSPPLSCSACFLPPSTLCNGLFTSSAQSRSVIRPPPRFRKPLPPKSQDKSISTSPLQLARLDAQGGRVLQYELALAREAENGPSGYYGSSARSYENPSVTSATSGVADDEAVRAHFDIPGPSYYISSTSHLTPTGLFLHPLLTSPLALRTITSQTLRHAQHLVDRINSVLPDFQPSFPESPFGPASAASPYEQSRKIRQIPKMLDRLSDTICLVIDMCELIRNTHPSEDWVREADSSYEVLGSYMNGLNTDTGLYDALLLCLNTPHNPPLSPSELQLIDTFKRDFEKSGIHLPNHTRQRFVDLSDDIQVLGRRFLGDVASAMPTNGADAGEGLSDGNEMIEIPDAARLLEGLGHQFLNSLPGGTGRSRGSRFVAPQSWAAQMILRHARNAEARKLVYEGSNQVDSARVGVLEELLVKRGELAGVLGKESWADVVLSDKMAKTPENAMGFLQSLAEHQRPSALADLSILGQHKRAEIPGNQSPTIYAWDRDYYSERHMQSVAPTRSLHPISPFLSAGTILQGLSRLFTRLYGLSFVPVDLRPGEAWHEDVRKLNVVDENEGVIGVIYCDLFSRSGKPPSAAHYTVRCSRRIDDDDVQGDLLPQGWDMSKGMTGVEDVAGVSVRGKPGRYQLPLVVLSTDFAPPSEEDGPSCLAWQEVETLFHEMGHAIHSMLGRTEYHNVSGTRCATDFVELPSILMELFVSDPTVLPLFARHHTTDLPLPLSHFQAATGQLSSLSSLETHGQILMASLDQVYHSPIARSSGFDSTQVYYDLQSSIGVIPSVPNTAWQIQFGHLYGYGATYYSYLFDRAIANKVWSTLFAQDPLSREGGEKFRSEVLKWGGGKDPWEMVGEAVGDERLMRGDSGAMKEVGSWLRAK